MPIGYKNSTDGSATIAINAMQAAAKPHHFLGINREGHASIVSTSGNPNGHLVLRGGNRGTNYHLEAIQESADELTGAGLPDRLMVDCSHANSSKDFRRQSEVLRAVASQVDQKSDHVMGGMRPSKAQTAANSALPRKTCAPLPSRLLKLRVLVENTVVLSSTRA